MQTIAFILYQIQHEVYEQITSQATFICPHTVHVVKHLCCKFKVCVFGSYLQLFRDMPYLSHTLVSNTLEILPMLYIKIGFKGRFVILTLLTYATVNLGLLNVCL